MGSKPGWKLCRTARGLGLFGVWHHACRRVRTRGSGGLVRNQFPNQRLLERGKCIEQTLRRGGRVSRAAVEFSRRTAVQNRRRIKARNQPALNPEPA